MSGQTLLHFLPGVENLDKALTQAFGGGVLNTNAESSIHVLIASAVFLIILVWSCDLCAALIYESPGGYQVDGLPPARRVGSLDFVSSLNVN